MMTPVLAAAAAANLIIPQAEFYIPPKPAFVKAQHLDMSRHILLGMPMTMGMLSAGGESRPTLISTLELTNASTAEFSQNITVPAGTVLVAAAINSRHGATAATLSSVTLGGVAMTAASAWGQVNNRPGCGIYYRAASLSGAQAFSLQYSNQGTGGQVVFFFFSSFNATSPIGQTGTASTTSGNSLSIARDPDASQPFIVVAFTHYRGSGDAAGTPSYTNLTPADTYITTNQTYIGAYNSTLLNPGSTTFGVSLVGAIASTNARMALVEFK